MEQVLGVLGFEGGIFMLLFILAVSICGSAVTVGLVHVLIIGFVSPSTSRLSANALLCYVLTAGFATLLGSAFWFVGLVFQFPLFPGLIDLPVYLCLANLVLMPISWRFIGLPVRRAG